MSSPVYNEQLQPYLEKPDYIAKTAEQLIKDFRLSGLDIEFDSSSINAYRDLFIELKQQLAQLMKTDAEKLMHLFYRIDMNETNMLQQNDVDYLAQLIIMRELQKVVYKEKYK